MREVAIARVLTVPEVLQINGPVRVAVRQGADRLVNREVEELVERFPLLRACGYLHSHPFAVGSTRPSRGPGCDLDGHLRPLLEHNRQAGLEAAFSFIACRAAEDPGWRLQGFALDELGMLCDLGFARVIPDQHALLRRAGLPGLEQRPLQRKRLRRWRYELRRQGIRYSQDELFGGWQRTVLQLDPINTLVVLLPIDYPEARPLCFAVNRATGATQPLSVDLVDFFSQAGGSHGC
jgi:hypothetical protein